MKKLFLSASLLLAAIIQCAAGNLQYSCIELSPLDGYPSKINSVLVRNAGYTWIGSDDGIYFLTGGGRVSKYDTNSAAAEGWSFPGMRVYKVFEDPRGTVWVLTDGGFAGYATNFGVSVPTCIPGAGEDGQAFSVTARGDKVYFGGENCVWEYDHATGTLSKLFTFSTEKPFRVTDMFFGSGDDMIVFSKSGLAPFIYNTATKVIRHYEIDWKPEYFASFVDSRKTLWVSDFGHGVSCFDTRGNKVASYDTASGLASDIVLCFAERTGRIWMGTDGGGINVLDPVTGTVEVIEHVDGDPSSIPSSTVSSLYIDSESRVWCGRPSGGLFILAAPFINFIPSESTTPSAAQQGFTALAGTSDGSIWVGTGGRGLFRFDPETSGFTFCPATDGMNIYTMVELDDRRLLLACPNRGCYVYDTGSGSLTRFTGFDGTANNYAADTEGASLAVDELGRVLSFSSTVERYDPATGKAESFTFPTGMGKGGFHAVYGASGRYFVDDLNLYRWDENADCKAEILHSFDNASPIRSAVLSQDVAWIMAGHELFSYELGNGRMNSYSIPIPTRPLSVSCDKNGRLWIGTQSNLYVFHPQDGKVISLGNVDGIKRNEYAPHGKLVAGNGDIYLCGKTGLVHVPASTNFSSYREPVPAVTNFLVDGKPAGKFSNLAIPFKHGTIEIEFFAVGRDVLQSDIYRFHSEGPGYSMDTESDVPRLRFYRLNPGKYTVTVSTNRRDGSWTEPAEVTSFRVQPPWYRSVPFFLGLVALLLLVLLIVNRSFHRTIEFEKGKKADEERYNFLVNVSHELRTPLTLVLGPLARMRSDASIPPAQRAKLESVFRQAEKMKTLLNTVLTTGKVQSGATVLAKEHKNFNTWARECADSFADEAEARGMSIVLKPDNAVGMVEMDASLCQVVFSNMMMNALKHNRKGLAITVRTEALPSKGMVRLCIRDHGAGIHGLDVSKIFEQYYQATEESTGFGIGLSYSKTIIDAHEGLIGAYNNVGDEGATFWFELPVLKKELRRAVAAAAAATAAAAQVSPKHVPITAPQAAPKDLTGVTMLFVDDDEEMRDYVLEEFKGSVKSILVASGGKEALTILKSTKPDVIISDVMMPDMDGMDLCHNVKLSYATKHIPFIMLTARADDKSRENGSRNLCDAYVTKPFETSELLCVISKLIR